MRNEKRKDRLYIKIEFILELNKKFDARIKERARLISERSRIYDIIRNQKLR